MSNTPQTRGKFALVEDGTSRVIFFLTDGTRRVRLLDGSWTNRWPNTDEVVTAEELGAFRAASRNELSALAQEALASS